MRTRFRQTLLLGISLAGSGLAATCAIGCDRSCEASATCIPDGWPESLLHDPCPDPADGPVEEGCGIWVSHGHGQDTNPGSRSSPVQTISQAIELAEGGRRRLYLCGETYAEPVRFPSGLTMFGGFDCEHGWEYVGLSHRAKIAPAPGFIALTFEEGDEPSTVGDIEARSADAVEPGASSIAVLIEEKAKGSFRRADIFSGNGADGQDGEDGDHDGYPAKDGLWGNDGANACTADAGLGGAAVILQCGEGMSSSGGAGGDGLVGFASNGDDGSPILDESPSVYGKGGLGESSSPLCTSGAGGVQGAAGEAGAPDKSAGHITKEGLVLGGDGGDGQSGKPGQGGGGGGASLGNAAVCGALAGGAGGGSGGTGGCGGRPGTGGQAGGSSIGLAALGEGVQVSGVRIIAGNGGKGGEGGTAQGGGQGGLPGPGGTGFGGAGGVTSGCAGGAGGNGGSGGHGAGGRGGYSTAVALVGIPNLVLDGGSVPTPGNHGHGGKGGDLSAAELEGLTGTIPAPYMFFDP